MKLLFLILFLALSLALPLWMAYRNRETGMLVSIAQGVLIYLLSTAINNFLSRVAGLESPTDEDIRTITTADLEGLMDLPLEKPEQDLEEKSGDDKLQYRLGQMLHTGTGTEKDDGAAADYWERAAKLGNVHAQYALGKLWLETGSGSTAQAVRWITKAAEAGNAAAQYALGKLFLSGEVVEKDAARAVELFTLSAGQGNEYAAYRLGRLYLSGEELPRDEREAVHWLMLFAGQGNQYAQYALGKLYLTGEDIPKDVEKAVQDAIAKIDAAATAKEKEIMTV